MNDDPALLLDTGIAQDFRKIATAFAIARCERRLGIVSVLRSRAR